MLKKAVFTVPGENGDFHSLEVQYNPSSLKLTAAAKPVIYTDAQNQKLQGQVKQNMDSGEMGLSLDLIIDDDGGRDVRKTIQGFLGMVSDKTTRKIAFDWGDMNFEGNIRHISASFEMFDESGRPVRGKVHMEITRQDLKGVVSDEL